MKKCILGVLAALLLASSCVDDGNRCIEQYYQCEVRYSRETGYYRDCNNSVLPCGLGAWVPRPNFGAGGSSETGSAGAAPTLADVDAGPSLVGSQRGGDDEASGGTGGIKNPGVAVAGGERYSAFEIPCTRDSQCGPGKCNEGACFYGCSSDAQCGSGDRCAVETGTRICLPDPNPPVECTRSAQCEAGHVCLNASCRQTCTSTEQCTNLLDRCSNGVCEPDRRPLGECVLDIECADGLACLDGACVPWCSADSDAGACAGGTPSDPVTPAQDAGGDPGNLPGTDDPVSSDAGAPSIR